MQNFIIPPPLLPPPINVEIGMMQTTFCSIFNIERGGEGALGIKLTPVNVQVSQHF